LLFFPPLPASPRRCAPFDLIAAGETEDLARSDAEARRKKGRERIAEGIKNVINAMPPIPYPLTSILSQPCAQFCIDSIWHCREGVMFVEFRVEGDAAAKIRELAGKRLEDARETLVKEAMVRTLQETIVRNPVETGRARAAWVRSLEELGGAPPAGWEGPSGSGVGEGRMQGRLTQHTAQGGTEIEASSTVPYVGYLEYGTSKKAPFAMVRSAVWRMAFRVRGLFRW